MSMKWNGEAVKRRVNKAVSDGMNATLAAMVLHAKQNHTFENQTGTLEGSINFEPAKSEPGGRMRGLFGSFDVNYAIYVELGTIYMLARPFLRPAFDAEARNLSKRIERAFRIG